MKKELRRPEHMEEEEIQGKQTHGHLLIVIGILLSILALFVLAMELTISSLS